MKYAFECGRTAAQVSSLELSAYFVMQSNCTHFDSQSNAPMPSPHTGKFNHKSPFE